MKSIYKILAIMLFSLTATLNAQLKNVDGTTNDEYLGKQPLTGGECNCVNSDIPNFNFSFSSDFLNAIANDRAVIEAAKRQASDWYNHQTDLMKDYIGYKNNKTFSTYDEARNYFYRKTENSYIRNNAPSAKQKIASTYYNANNAEKTGLKGLKALSYREGEINKGNLDNSLYADFKVNGVPLKDIRTISELNNIRATVNTSTVKGLWQSDQYYAMLNEINSMISSSNYSELENLAFNKKNSLYHGYNYWDRLNMIQLQLYFQDHTQYVNYPHFLPDGVFEKFHNTIEIATPNFIENEVEKNYTEYNLFHADHWKIILKDKYNNSPFYTSVAKAEHQALMNAELNRLKSRTPMGASLNVDKIVQQFQIRDKNQYEWLNANPEKADEFIIRLADAKALDAQENSEPIPDDEIISVVGENYNTEKNEINNEIDYGGRIVSLIKELNITDINQKKWMYQNTKNVSRFEVELTVISSDLFKNLIAHASNPLITEEQRITLINNLINDSEPEINSDNILDYKAEFLRMSSYLKRAGSLDKKIFGQFVEDVADQLINLKYGEVLDLYKVVRQQYFNAKFDYVLAILFTAVESFKPVIQASLIAVGGGATVRILQSIPTIYVSTELSLVLTRLSPVFLPAANSTFSAAYKSLLHASKYGIQTYSQLELHLRNLGINRTENYMQIHHLIEQRFLSRPGVAQWLGSNTNNWKSIVVSSVPGSGNEHYLKFTKLWKEAIAYGNGAGWTGANTNNVTLEQIKIAAKEIYADYPEFLQAIGLN